MSCRKQRHGAGQKEADDYGSYEPCTYVCDYWFLVLVVACMHLSLARGLGLGRALFFAHACSNWVSRQVQPQPEELGRLTVILKLIVRQLPSGLQLLCTSLCDVL